MSTSFRRGMWVWNGYVVASSPTAFIAECKRIKITDVFLYLTVSNYGKVDILRKFIAQLSANNIKAWGLDGARKYFRDVEGPAGLFASVNALTTYNAKVSPNERFYGFQTDNEPDYYGTKFPDTFHNDIPTSKLSKTSGGVYKASAFADRQFILKDWLSTQKQTTTMLRQNGLRSGAALPSWLDDYYGEPLTTVFDGKSLTMMGHMFNYVDDYVIMSYQTDLNKVSQRVKTELTFGDRFTPLKQVFPSLETVKGRGGAVTYGDNATKKFKSVVLKDIATMEGMFKGHPCFGGICIHDWQGWQALAP